MPTLYSIIDLSPSKLFKKFLTIQTIIPTIVISILITTVLLFSTTSIYAEEIENEADNGMSELINSGKELLKQFIYEIDGTKSNTTYTEEKDLNPDTQIFLNHGREMLEYNKEPVEKSHEQINKQELEMTYAEKKAKNDPEYAKLLQHNKELYEKEHPGWQNEPKNELDAMYSDKEYKKVIKPHEFGKATIPFLGAWEESKIADHKLIYCVDDSVDPYLEANARDAFKYWSYKLHDLNNDEPVITFQGTTLCDKADVKVLYQDTDSKDDYAATAETYHNTDNTIYYAEIILYPNFAQQKDGYDYERSGEWGELPEYNEDIANDGPKDNEYYKWSLNNIKHEVGHVLGLDHITDNPNYIMYAEGKFEVNYPISGCEAVAIFKKNFVERDLDEVICEPS